jgi:hypothetical protein
MMDQLFKNGTLIKEDINESQGRRSDSSFKNNGAMTYNEEAAFWLRSCKHADSFPFQSSMIGEIEAKRIIGTII